jgi:hypothetical protein
MAGSLGAEIEQTIGDYEWFLQEERDGVTFSQ